MPFGGQNSNGGQRRKKIAIIGTSALILVAMVVAVAVGFNRSESDSQSAAPTSPPPSVSTTTKAIQVVAEPHVKVVPLVVLLKILNSYL